MEYPRPCYIHTHTFYHNHYTTGGPEAYACFGREIGDARVLHGLIAVTIFVRARHVREGAFQVQQGAVNRVATGVNLGPMGRAANKGG